MADVAEMLSEPVSTIRWWINEVNILQRPPESAKRKWKFSERDVKTLRSIQYLVRVKGLRLDNIKANLSKYGQEYGIDKQLNLIGRLEKLQCELTEIIDELKRDTQKH